MTYFKVSVAYGLLLLLLVPAASGADPDTTAFPVRKALLSPDLRGEQADVGGFQLRYEAPEVDANPEAGKMAYMAIGHESLPDIVGARLTYRAVSENATQTGEVVFADGRIISPTPPANFPPLTDWLQITPGFEFRHWRLGVVNLRPNHTRQEAGEEVHYTLTSGNFEILYGVREPNVVPVEEHRDAREVVEALVVNEGSLTALARPRASEPAALPTWLQSPALLVLTEQEGLHQVEQKRIAEVLGSDLNKQDLSVYFHGRPVPIVFRSDIYGSDDGPGRFLPGDRLVFYAPRVQSPYSTENAFWVTRSGDSPRMTVEAGRQFDVQPQELIIQDTAVFEEDHAEYYDDDETMPRNADQGDYWFWQLVGPASYGDRGPFERTLPLRDVAVQDATATLTIELAGEDIRRYLPVRSNQIALRFNGQMYTGADLNVVAKQEERGRLTVKAVLPPEVLAPTVRSASFNIALGVVQDLLEDSPEQEVSFYVDALRLEYPRRVQLYHGVTDYTAVVRSSDLWRIPSDWVRYQNLVAVARVQEDDYRVLPTQRADDDFLVDVSSLADVTGPIEFKLQDAITLLRPKRYESFDGPALRRPDIRADAVIVSPRYFREGARAYEQLYEKRGVATQIAWLDNVYREFGDGEATPHAVRDMLRYAFENWQQPAPAYVLLIGDASWDWKQRFQNTIPNLMPSFRKDPLYASDNWFVCLTGEDAVPDMFLGRLPVQTLDHLASVLRKSRLAIEDPKVGAWRARGIFVSDNYDTAGNLFEKNTRELMVEWTPPGLDMKQIPFRDYAYEDNRFIPEEYRALEGGKMKYSPDANQAIIGAINDGCALFEYFGHGGPNVFGHERILFGGGSVYSDIKKLNNDEYWPFVTGMTCDSGRIDYADVKWNLGIGEELLLHETGGAIGVFASTGKGYPHQHLPLMEGLHEAIFRQGWRRMGMVTTATKLLYALSRPDEVALDMFLLLGDPIAPLPVPDSALTMELNVEEVDLRYGAYVEATVTLPSDWPEYGLRAHVYGRDSNDQEFFSREMRVSSHTFDFGFDVNPGGEPGPYRIGAYVYQTRLKETDLVLEGVASDHFEAVLPETEPADVTGTPNLTVQNVTFSNYSPKDGRTVFIDATVQNTGEGTARNIHAEAYVGDPDDEGEAVVDIVDWPRQVLERLDPGESGRVHFRWDPFMNAGRHDLYVKADPRNQIEESDETDNKAYQVLTVREKADLVFDASNVTVEAHPENPALLLVRLDLKNVGESPAEGVLPPGELREEAGDDGFGFAWVLWPAEGALPITQIRAYPKLPAGQTIPLALPFPRQAHRMVVVADAEEVIDEITHDNNKFSLYMDEALELLESSAEAESGESDPGAAGESGE